MSVNKLMKQKFGFDVTALASYTDEQSTEILVKEVIRSKTIDMATVQTGVKETSKIKKLDVDVTYQDGTNCAQTASGDVVLSDRTITVSPITVLLKLCANDLHGTWGELALQAGSVAETQNIPYEQVFLSHFLAKNRYELEKLVWQGNTATGSGNLALANGFVTIADNNKTSLVDLNVDDISSVTSTNAYDAFYKAFEAMPEEVLEAGARLFMPRSWYTALNKNLVDLNFNLDYIGSDAGSRDAFVLPGTDLICERIPGLTNVERAFIAKPQELVVGTDLEGDFEDIRTWYSEDDDNMKIRLKFKIGVQIPFLDQWGRFALGAS